MLGQVLLEDTTPQEQVQTLLSGNNLDPGQNTPRSKFYDSKAFTSVRAWC